MANGIGGHNQQLEDAYKGLFGQTGQPPLAAYHEAVRLLPSHAHKALIEAGVNLERPSKDDRSIIDDLRHFHKLPKFPWPEPEKPVGPRGQQ